MILFLCFVLLGQIPSVGLAALDPGVRSTQAQSSLGLEIPLAPSALLAPGKPWLLPRHRQQEMGEGLREIPAEPYWVPLATSTSGSYLEKTGRRGWREIQSLEIGSVVVFVLKPNASPPTTWLACALEVAGGLQ